jgi:hypothetical protein
MGLSISDLENDFLRGQLKELKIKIKESDTILTDMLHDFLMSTFDGGLGESAEYRTMAEDFVSEFKGKRIA